MMDVVKSRELDLSTIRPIFRIKSRFQSFFLTCIIFFVCFVVVCLFVFFFFCFHFFPFFFDKSLFKIRRRQAANVEARNNWTRGRREKRRQGTGRYKRPPAKSAKLPNTKPRAVISCVRCFSWNVWEGKKIPALGSVLKATNWLTVTTMTLCLRNIGVQYGGLELS